MRSNQKIKTHSELFTITLLRKLGLEVSGYLFYGVAMIFVLVAVFVPVSLAVLLGVVLSFTGLNYLLKVSAYPPANKMRLLNYFMGVMLVLAISAHLLMANSLVGVIFLTFGAQIITSLYLSSPQSRLSSLSPSSKFIYGLIGGAMLGLSILYILMLAQAFPATLVISPRIILATATLCVGILAAALMKLSAIIEKINRPAARYDDTMINLAIARHAFLQVPLSHPAYTTIAAQQDLPSEVSMVGGARIQEQGSYLKSESKEINENAFVV